MLLYDGTCGVCARSVQFILRHDRHRKSLRFASLESDFGRRIIGSDPELARVDSLVWAEPAATVGEPGAVGPGAVGRGAVGPGAVGRGAPGRGALEHTASGPADDAASVVPPPYLAPGGPFPKLRILVRSDAVLAVAAYLGGLWRGLAMVGRIVPRPVRDFAYDLVARNRHRVAGRSDSCLLPTPAERARFLDGPDADDP